MLKRTRNTFITSDLHFGHANICRYCNRPYPTVAPNKNPANAPLVQKMNEDILSLFDKLPSDCDIWNLGDFFYTGSGKAFWEDKNILLLDEYTKRMRGEGRRLFLVLGNHDTGKSLRGSSAEFYRTWFDAVYDTPIVFEDRYILSHEPVYLNPGSNLINIHGHIHDMELKSDFFCYNEDNMAQASREGSIQIKDPTKMVDPKNYFNACLDYHHSLLEWKSVLPAKYDATKIWNEK